MLTASIRIVKTKHIQAKGFRLHGAKLHKKELIGALDQCDSKEINLCSVEVLSQC